MADKSAVHSSVSDETYIKSMAGYRSLALSIPALCVSLSSALFQQSKLWPLRQSKRSFAAGKEWATIAGPTTCTKPLSAWLPNMADEFRMIQKSLAICRALADTFGAPCSRKPSTAAYRFWRPTAAASCADCWVENLRGRTRLPGRVRLLPSCKPQRAGSAGASPSRITSTSPGVVKSGSGEPLRPCCRHEESAISIRRSWS